MDRFCSVTTKKNMGNNRCSKMLPSFSLLAIPRLQFMAGPGGVGGMRSNCGRGCE